MFQYAFAKSLGDDVFFDKNYYDNKKYKHIVYGLNFMKTDVKIATRKQIKDCLLENFITSKLILLKKVYGVNFVKSNRVFESVRNKYEEGLLTSEFRDIYYDGYFQSYKYFENIKARLLKDFNLKYGLGDENKKILENITNTNSVAISIRQGGDYKKLGWNLKEDYYAKAIEAIKQRLINPIFYIFTDNASYLERDLFNGLNKILCNSYDLNSGFACGIYLMSNCKHVIVSNSSYSWWGAWLNRTNMNRIIYAPKCWLPTAGVIKTTYGELIPNGWECI